MLDRYKRKKALLFEKRSKNFLSVFCFGYVRLPRGSGRSQAVRLPKDFRFDTDRVRVRRKGSAVILEPIPRNWDWLETIIGTLDEDFVKATEEPLPEQERPDLDVFE